MRLRVLLALPGILGPLGVLGFIIYTETAHDPDRCPYQHVIDREVGVQKKVVREERRRCLESTEERRYSLVRADGIQILGRRRFAPEAFESPGYHWDAGVDDAGELHMVVHNPGKPSVTFRQGRPGEYE